MPSIGPSPEPASPGRGSGQRVKGDPHAQAAGGTRWWTVVRVPFVSDMGSGGKRAGIVNGYCRCREPDGGAPAT